MKNRLSFCFYTLLFGSAILYGCASSFLQYEKTEELKQIGEFENQVKIDAPELNDDDVRANDNNKDIDKSASKPSDKEAANVSENIDIKTNNKTDVKSDTVNKTIAKSTKNLSSDVSKKSKVKEKKSISGDSNRHEPDLEGQTGFVARRPERDPFRVGERVVHEVSYFATKAGELEMRVLPFAQVNGKKSYHFRIGIKTASVFDMFYSVDDYVSILTDFESFVPSVFTLHVKESKQLREARFFLDEKTKKARYWVKKVTKDHGPEEKKLEWDALEYSQNVFSAVFYMRVFNWVVGQENAFRVTDDQENMIFRGRAIRKEKISTDAGDFNTIVIKPEIELKGKFKPVGDIFVWLSDDDRKFILKIESKIKIGTLVSEVVKLDRGKLD